MNADVTGLAPRPRGRPRAPLSLGMIETIRGCAEKVEQALAMRIGQMDSQSRIDAIMREQRQMLEDVVRTLRSLA